MWRCYRNDERGNKFSYALFLIFFSFKRTIFNLFIGNQRIATRIIFADSNDNHRDYERPFFD